ncbi:MAG TPA: DUF4112 domain-containing protein [Acidisarcina sp.]
MRANSRPEILPPLDTQVVPVGDVPQSVPHRTDHGQVLFSDENLDRLSHLLDDCFTVPGTSIRFGLDGIVGFVPGLGDLLGGLASCILLIAAWFRGVPYVTLVRMVANVAIEVGVGAIPVFGNLFDIAWKANRRNYALLTRHLAQPHRHTWRDWVFLSLLALALLAVVSAPVLLLAAVVWRLLTVR